MPSLFREFPIEGQENQIGHDYLYSGRYERFGLNKNPFPLGGNFPEGYLPYTHLIDSQGREIRDFLVSTFFRNEFNGMIILGEYGTGKSHLLQYIHETVNTDDEGVFGGRALAFLIENPSVAPEDILLSMLRTIRLETIQDLIFLPVRRALKDDYNESYHGFLKRFTDFSNQMPLDANSSIASNYDPPSYSDLLNSKGYREFLQQLAHQNLKLNVKEMRDYSCAVLEKSGVSDNPIILASFVGLVFGDDSRDAQSWETFLVRDLVGKQSRVVGVEYYLKAILQLFRLMGINHVYLLVDEFEDLRTQRLSKKAATEYLATLRRMIQANYSRFSFVLASTKIAWDELRLYYPAIEDRFPVTIELVRNPTQVKAVIANYLRHARSVSYVGEDIYYPFTEEALDRLIEVRDVLLRHVITECRRLIDYGLDEEIEAPLTPDFVNHVMLVD